MKSFRFSNLEVARLLKEIVAVYAIKGENRFRLRAYENAAASVEHATEDLHSLWQEGHLQDLPGIGATIAGHLDELFRTGKVKHFVKEKKGLPPAMFSLLGLPGLGAKTAFVLARKLKLKPGQALSDLKKAAEQGKIAVLDGFGETSQGEILENLSQPKKGENRMLLPAAQEIAQRLLNYLRQSPKVVRAEPLGSLRRGVATVGDIDLAVATESGANVVRYFCAFPETEEILNQGKIKGRIRLKNGRQVDLMTEKPEAFGALLQHFTGSKNHNIHLRELALKQGLSLSEHGIRQGRRLRKIAGEEQFYQRLGLAFIPPELREDRGEIESALKDQLPSLIAADDLKGDLQCHTVWSDGANTVAEMVQKARLLGYEYLGITDHQMSLESRGFEAVKREIRRRKRAIEHISGSDLNIGVLNGLEVIIKVDGQLAYPDDLLVEFDYVLAAVHTGLGQGRSLITKRIVSALKNPFISALAHPTGRLLNEREGVDADWPEIYKVCVSEGKALEIDAMPERLDLPDLMVQEAKSAGVKFLVDSDAHATDQLEIIKYGVTVARRGWLTKNDVLNTLPFAKLKQALGIKF